MLRKIVATLAVTSFGVLAAHASPDWTNQGPDNNFSNGANWTTATATGQVPGPQDSAHIFPGFTTSPGTTGSINVTQGGKTSLVINSSTNQSIGELLVSSVFNSTTVANGNLQLNFTNGSTLTIGASSTGNVVITGGSSLGFSGNLTDNGGVIQIGATYASTNIDPGQVSGSGTFSMNNGNYLFQNAYISVASGTNGLVNQGQVGSSTNSATVTLQDSGLIVGDGFYGSATGVYNLNNSSLLNVNGSSAIYVGDYGSVGNFTVNNSSTLNLNSGTALVLGYQGGVGNFTQNNGTVNFFDTSAVVIGAGGSGTYTLAGGLLNINNNEVDIGGSGVGYLIQNGGSLVQSTSNLMYIGANGQYVFNAGSAIFDGSIEVDNGGLFIQNGSAFLVYGTGGMTIDSGGTFQLNNGSAYFNAPLTDNGALNLSGTLEITEDQLSGSGTLTFNGGTLKLTSGSSTTGDLSISTVILGAGSSTIDASASNLTSYTIDNELSGSGNISFVGNGATDFVLNSTGSNTGTMAIANGILEAPDTAIQYTKGLIANAGGTFNLNLSASGTYGGSISGTGVFNVNYNSGGDTFSLTGTNINLTGSIVLGANSVTGTLQVFGGTFAAIDDAGSGSAVEIGDGTSGGTVTINNASYMGQTHITPTYTLYASNLGGDVVNEGTLGTVGSLFSPGTLTINNNGAFVSTGTLFVRANGTTADEYINMGAGATTLSGTVNVYGAGTNQYVIVQTGGGGLDMTGLTTNPATTLFGSTVSDTGTGGVLLSTVQKPLSPFATTPNQLAVATSLDPLTQTPTPAFAQLLTVFNNMPASDIPIALEQLTPESLQFPQFIAANNSTVLVEKMNGFMSNLRNGYSGLDTSGVSFSAPGFSSGLGRSMGQLLAYNNPPFHNAAPNGVNYYPDNSGLTGSPAPAPSSSTTTRGGVPNNSSSPTTYDGQVLSDSPIPMRTSEPPTIRTSNFSEFIGGDVVLSDINQMQNMSSNASYTAADVIAGVAFRMTSNLSIGVLFDYNHTNAQTDGSGSRTTLDSYTPGLFATYFKNNFYINGLFAYSFNDYSNTRNIPFLGESASSAPGGQQFTADLDFGYDFHPAKDWVVTPTLGVTYTHLNVDSYSETGAPLADLNVNSQSSNSVRSRLGGHVLYQAEVGNVVLQPTVTAMWQHEYLDPSSMTSSFQDFTASPFTTQTISPAKDSALLGTGLTATLNNSMSLYLNYFANVGQDYLTQSIIGGFKASF